MIRCRLLSIGDVLYAMIRRLVLERIMELHSVALQRQQQDQSGESSPESSATGLACQALSALGQRLYTAGLLSTLPAVHLAAMAACMARLRLHDAELMRHIVAETWRQAPLMSAGTASTLLWAAAM